RAVAAFTAAGSDPPPGSSPVTLPDLPLEELAGLVARQVIDEVNRARPLVVGEASAAPVDQLLIARGCARLKSHHRLAVSPHRSSRRRMPATSRTAGWPCRQASISAG